MSKKGEFVAGSGREPLNLTKEQIEYAMSNTKTNTAAARFLSLNIQTYRKYAKMYIDEKTGKNLYELHKKDRAGNLNIGNTINRGRGVPLEEILEGKHPKYSRSALGMRLKNIKIIPIVCAMCGFNEYRIDGKIPLVLNSKDGDHSNHKKENLEFLCYNCTFLSTGRTRGRNASYYH